MRSANGIRAFEGASAIVTGGGSGIGRALGKALALRGANVVLADREIAAADEAAAATRSLGGRVIAARVDVTDAPAVLRLVKETRERTGRLDYMFNNAGIASGGEIRHHQLADWDAVIDVNLRGVIHGVHAAYPVMIEQGFGHIVNTASMAGLMATPFAASYGATKSAVVALSLALRIEAAEHGVRAGVLCPGVVRTPLLDGGKFGRAPPNLPRERMRGILERLWPIEPDPFARRALAAVRRNRAIIIVPGWWRVFWWIGRLSPGLQRVLARKAYRDTIRIMS